MDGVVVRRGRGVGPGACGIRCHLADLLDAATAAVRDRGARVRELLAGRVWLLDTTHRTAHPTPPAICSLRSRHEFSLVFCPSVSTACVSAPAASNDPLTL